MCYLAPTDNTTIQTLNMNTAGNVSILCMLNLQPATEEMIDFEVIRKIEYYYDVAKRIWRIFPIILLGKFGHEKICKNSVEFPSAFAKVNMTSIVPEMPNRVISRISLERY